MKYLWLALIIILLLLVFSQKSGYDRPKVEFDETFKDSWVPRAPL